MEGFLVNYYEYHFLYINGIEHVESKSIQGVGLIKLQFILARTCRQRLRRRSPTSTAPVPLCGGNGAAVRHALRCRSVPVGDLVFSTDDRSSP